MSVRARSDALIRRFRRRPNWSLILVLALTWIFFWGDLSWGNLVAGMALGYLVTALAPMPVAFAGRRITIRPLATVVLAGRFLWDVVVATVGISWMILRGRQPQGAVIRVHLRSYSDSFLTATAGMTSLVPGSIVVDAHRLTGMLYIHIFDVEMSGGLERAHDAVLEQEVRLLRAFATPDELLDAGLTPPTFGVGRRSKPSQGKTSS